MASKTHEWPIYFVPARKFNDGNYVAGHPWRVAARSTSFYLKTRDAMQDRKISLHGPDERHPQGPLLKFGRDRSFTPSENKRGSVLSLWGDVTGEELQFYGEPIIRGVRRVVRLRWSWELFQDGAYTEDASKPIGTAHQGAKILTAPHFPHALDVDFYLSDHAPYWPDKKEIQRKDAGMGPLRNDADQYLTAVVMHNSLIRHPSLEPDEKLFQLPTSMRDRVRGFHSVVHPDGYLHHEEIWMPQQDADRLGRRTGGNAG